jgi:hypothetical protein
MTDSSASEWFEAAERYRRGADHVRELIVQSGVIAFRQKSQTSAARQPIADRSRLG